FYQSALSAARRELGRIIKKDTRPTEYIIQWSIGRRVAARPDKAKRDQCVPAARGIPDARVSSCSFEKTDNHPPATIRAARTKQRLICVAAAARGEELIARQHDSFWQAKKSLSPGVNRHTRCRVSLSPRRTRDRHNVAESQCSLYGCTRAPSHSRDLLSKPRQNLIKISYGTGNHSAIGKIYTRLRAADDDDDDDSTREAKRRNARFVVDN
ncbi:unnamed protein product, partial [Trichogramma brassicae]